MKGQPGPEDVACGVFVGLGVKKIRLTGGEPLLRKDLPDLVAMLAPLGADLTLTTNGAALAKKAASLRDAGLTRVTVSLDSLDDATFRAMNDEPSSRSSRSSTRRRRITAHRPSCSRSWGRPAR